jgi:ABC-type nitrate/sulfonate/bicarbonate transport system permease component
MTFFERRSPAYRKWLLRGLSIGLLIVLWQWRGSQPGAFALPPFTKVIAALWQALISGDLLTATSGTLVTMLVGYFVAAAIGIPLGIGIALSAWIRNTIEPIVVASYTSPVSIFIPIIGLYFGLGFQGRVVLVLLWSVFVIVVNTTAGIRETPPIMVEMATAFRATRFGTLRTIMLPWALPYILTGLRLGFGRALRGAITAEVLLSAANLGAFLSNAGELFNMPRLLAGIVFITLLGVVLLRMVEHLETAFLHRWHYIE